MNYAQTPLMVDMAGKLVPFDRRAITSFASDINIEFFEQDADNFMQNKVTVRIDFRINKKLHGVFFSLPRDMFKPEHENSIILYVGMRMIKVINTYVKQYFKKQFNSIKRLKRLYESRQYKIASLNKYRTMGRCKGHSRQSRYRRYYEELRNAARPKWNNS